MKIKRTVTALFLAATMVLSTPFVAAEEAVNTTPHSL